MPRQRTQPGGTRGTVFEHVARVRLEDAAVLFRQQRYAGAIYLAGYAIECALKFAVTRRLEEIYLPAQFETHDWDALLLESGLRPAIARRLPVRSSFTELAELWGPELRYLAREPTESDANALYSKLLELYSWIRDNTV